MVGVRLLTTELETADAVRILCTWAAVSIEGPMQRD
jgi:hypothetical protein